MSIDYIYNNLRIPQATTIQKELRDKVDIAEREIEADIIGGADISLNMFGKTAYAGIVLMTFPSLQVVGVSLAAMEVKFPYVPGYLGFREVPALVKAWQQIDKKPDVIICDGHGYAHPRRLGIATHFGIVTGQPTIGCAKKKLFGEFREPSMSKGACTKLLHKKEHLGFVLRTKNNCKPVFVSPGHAIGVLSALGIVRACVKGYRLPEPTRLAHEFVNNFRRGELREGFTAMSI